MNFYVYCYTNIKNGKKYIGKTYDLDKRHQEHARGSQACPLFSNAIKKYGISGFDYSILGTYDLEEKANIAEMNFISLFKTNICRYGREAGYNMSDGGDGAIGHKHSEESKLKMSKSQKGHPTKQETRDKISNTLYGRFRGEESPHYNKSPSEETRKKIGDGNRGKTHSDEFKLMMSLKYSGDNAPFFGKKHSDASRQKMSETHIGLLVGSKNGMYGKTFENSQYAKLTWNKVEEIREKYLTGDFTYKQLASEYGVHTSTIGGVLANRLWKKELRPLKFVQKELEASNEET